MKYTTKRITALMMALVMTFIMIPFALAVDSTADGKCGENMSWTLYNDGDESRQQHLPWIQESG